MNDQRIESRKLQSGETYTNFINLMIELAQLTSLGENELCKAILRGLPDAIKHQVISHNPRTIDEVIQRVLLAESMQQNSSTSTLCSPDDRVITTKLENFVNKLTSSIDEIEKTFNSFKQTAETLSKSNSTAKLNCGVCGKNENEPV